MPTSKLTFGEGFLGTDAEIARRNNAIQKVFDWDKAAEIINQRLISDPELTADAGLEGDLSCTSGTIFENGKPEMESYTYLESNWAIPTLLINGDEEIPCWVDVGGSRFDSGSTWDEKSLEISNKKIISI